MRALQGALPTLRIGYAGKRTRSVGVGNALKVLIALADLVVASGPAGEAAGAQLLGEGACAVATEALMCPGRDGDPAAPVVRRNAATAVAKLARHPGCYAALKGLRAMEALVQLKELH